MTYKVLSSLTANNVNSADILKVKTDLLIIGVNKKTSSASELKDLKSSSNSMIGESMNEINNGTRKSIFLPAPAKVGTKNILLIKEPEVDAASFLVIRHFEEIMGMIKSSKSKDFAFLMSSATPKKVDLNWMAEVAARTFEAAAYTFNATKNKTAKPVTVKKGAMLFSGLTPAKLKSVKSSVQFGHAVGEGMNATKHLGDLPANHCTPRIIETKTKALKKDFPALKISSLNEKDLERLKMGSYLSVGKGSDEPSRMMTIEYRGGAKDKQPLVLVGKGITFDTGGISLKPGSAMDEMKWDMCGAASVFGIMQTLARLKAKVNVVGLLVCAENMPSARATKPGDVVTSMSGQTIEILNTDAEGRLVLCDALTYVKKFKPSHVIDMATLTGAVVVALGTPATGVMGNDQPLADKSLAAGEASGDRAWQLPLWEEYAHCTKTNFADLANIGGGREAGTITAASFLSNFTKEYKWAHMDIAASAWTGGAKKGGSGRPVPLLAELILKGNL